ncbi:DUF4197 domain-containing protein [Alkaliflexus imshenetskii]|uniref:DUF4197 domain-containing protein n=1 Tax=Alkaliflexus imshenetskii TaxID=286730 RepID=UPI0005C76E5E|nr:DUF4197 domain-containing protein [Alkaliflexus imshenetskii]
MRKQFMALAFTAFILSSCAELLQVVQTIDSDRPLTETEVVSGLKEALKVGTDSAARRLSRINGYYGDEMIRILLPPEAAVITENIHRIPGGEKMLQDLIIRINRSAEDAAKEVTPIFVNAITRMTIRDGFNILKGDKNAATQYLKANTYEQLKNLYQPKIKTSLDKALVAGISTNESWETLTSQWNRLAGSMAGQIAGLNKVEVELESYLTQRALDGLFVKLALEESKIRTDPMARVNDILKRVFGSKEAAN